MAHDHRMNPVGDNHLTRIKRLIADRVSPEVGQYVGGRVDRTYADPNLKDNRALIGEYFKNRHEPSDTKANEANQGYPTGDENRGESNDDMGSYDGHSYTDGDY
ncbi:hypothetical protein UFOVP1130_44 [uncultured Caudovirales phage]|uniref:Uncharacterized protein n=1 Tax=uncultured Caudovirales phage TaxID=2100421 RepID=A0A6J5QLW9_9CAUD|nr:hypothetical protein UFOVP1130_44 [uncultured Caudovirales phage]